MQLTDRQEEIVTAAGDFLLLACPGSGKTRAAAQRAARLVAEPRTKLAVCSYTNVGSERIGSVLERDLGVALDSRHFLGTIHAFLLKYVVYPYAHLLGATRGPFVREGGAWPTVIVHDDKKQRIPLDEFRYGADGSLVLTPKRRSVSGTDEEIINSVDRAVRSRKYGLFTKAGVLTADDAIWVALQVLRRWPVVATAVAGRFDELMLDEAQDTSELQLACLEVLHETGQLASLVLIGDLEQSIYSFQGASSERCAQLAQNCGLRREPLSENHRCSQRICNVAAHFCSRAESDIAVGPDARCEIEPEVVVYPAAEPGAAMETFRGRLAHHALKATDAVVLARGWKTVNALNGQTVLFDDDDRRHFVGHLAARIKDGTLTRSDVRATQRLLAYCAWDTHHLDQLDDEQQAHSRRAVYKFLTELPSLEGDLQAWIHRSAKVLHSAAGSLTPDLRHTGGRTLQAGDKLREHQASAVFAPTPPDLRARTVHSFKGEDSDAVMIVIRRHHGGDPTSQMELWEAAVAGADVAPKKEEERRVLFVALTRARRYCLVALPDDSRGLTVAAACADIGFRVVEATA